jgi:hypothetical protein
MNNKNIPLSTKLQVFYTVSRAIMCYGARVWGFQCYETVEKLIRFFLKKLYSLPKYTPTYMIHLETGTSEMYLYTLKLHFKYIFNILKFPEYRYPYIIANKIIKKKYFGTKMGKIWEENWVLFLKSVKT